MQFHPKSMQTRGFFAVGVVIYLRFYIKTGSQTENLSLCSDAGHGFSFSVPTASDMPLLSTGGFLIHLTVDGLIVFFF